MNTLKVLVMLAWRNLWRNHRRTGIMLAAIGFGVWAMIFMIALTQGMVNEMIKDGISTLPGHVQVHHPDYRDDPNINNLIPASDSALSEAMTEAGFETWATRVKVPAVVTSERESRGVTLLGVDPGRERDFSFVDYDAVEGRFLDAVDDRGVVIGRKLAETLDTEVGKRVVIMSQDPDNDIADRGFRVVGIYDANMESFENTYVLTGKTTLQSLLKVDDRVTEVVVAE
nr:ABC transporter permease [Woeseiaceae bacterium]